MMEKDSLIEALRKAEEEKLAAVPSEAEIDHAFSDGFEQKMDRLIRAQRQPGWNLVKTPVRRSLMLVLLLLLTFGVRPEYNPLFRLAQPVPQLNTAVPAAPEAGGRAAPPAGSAVRGRSQGVRAGFSLPDEPSPTEPAEEPSAAGEEPSAFPDDPGPPAPASAAQNRPAAASSAVPETPRQQTPEPETVPEPSETPEPEVISEPSEIPEPDSDAPARQNETPTYNIYLPDRDNTPEAEPAPERQTEQPYYVPLPGGTQTQAEEPSPEEDLPPGFTLPKYEPPTVPWDGEYTGSLAPDSWGRVQSPMPEFPTVVLDPSVF